MDALIKAKLQVGDRVVAFHLDRPPMNEGMQVAVVGLETALAEARRLDDLHRAGKSNSEVAVLTKADLRVTIRDGISLIAGLADSAMRMRRDVVLDIKMPYLKGHLETFVGDCRRALAIAHGAEDILKAFGMPDTLLAELDAALVQLTTRAKEKELGRNVQVGATAGLDRVTAQIMRYLRQLDRLNRFRYRNDPDALTAWRRARTLPPSTKPKDREKILPRFIGGAETQAN